MVTKSPVDLTEIPEGENFDSSEEVYVLTPDILKKLGINLLNIQSTCPVTHNTCENDTQNLSSELESQVKSTLDIVEHNDLQNELENQLKINGIPSSPKSPDVPDKKIYDHSVKPQTELLRNDFMSQRKSPEGDKMSQNVPSNNTFSIHSQSSTKIAHSPRKNNKSEDNLVAVNETLQPGLMSGDPEIKKLEFENSPNILSYENIFKNNTVSSNQSNRNSMEGTKETEAMELIIVNSENVTQIENPVLKINNKLGLILDVNVSSTSLQTLEDSEPSKVDDMIQSPNDSLENIKSPKDISQKNLSQDFFNQENNIEIQKETLKSQTNLVFDVAAHNVPTKAQAYNEISFLQSCVSNVEIENCRNIFFECSFNVASADCQDKNQLKICSPNEHIHNYEAYDNTPCDASEVLNKSFDAIASHKTDKATIKVFKETAPTGQIIEYVDMKSTEIKTIAVITDMDDHPDEAYSSDSSNHSFARLNSINNLLQQPFLVDPHFRLSSESNLQLTPRISNQEQNHKVQILDNKIIKPAYEQDNPTNDCNYYTSSKDLSKSGLPNFSQLYSSLTQFKDAHAVTPVLWTYDKGEMILINSNTNSGTLMTNSGFIQIGENNQIILNNLTDELTDNHDVSTLGSVLDKEICHELNEIPLKVSGPKLLETEDLINYSSCRAKNHDCKSISLIRDPMLITNLNESTLRNNSDPDNKISVLYETNISKKVGNENNTNEYNQQFDTKGPEEDVAKSDPKYPNFDISNKIQEWEESLIKTESNGVLDNDTSATNIITEGINCLLDSTKKHDKSIDSNASHIARLLKEMSKKCKLIRRRSKRFSRNYEVKMIGQYKHNQNTSNFPQMSSFSNSVKDSKKTDRIPRKYGYCRKPEIGSSDTKIALEIASVKVDQINEEINCSVPSTESTTINESLLFLLYADFGDISYESSNCHSPPYEISHSLCSLEVIPDSEIDMIDLKGSKEICDLVSDLSEKEKKLDTKYESHSLFNDLLQIFTNSIMCQLDMDTDIVETCDNNGIPSDFFRISKDDGGPIKSAEQDDADLIDTKNSERNNTDTNVGGLFSESLNLLMKETQLEREIYDSSKNTLDCERKTEPEFKEDALTFSNAEIDSITNLNKNRRKSECSFLERKKLSNESMSTKTSVARKRNSEHEALGNDTINKKPKKGETNPMLVSCGVCLKNVKAEDWLQHSAKEHNYMAWISGCAPINFDDKQDVYRHLNQVLKYTNMLDCTICGQIFKCANLYWDHITSCSQRGNETNDAVENSVPPENEKIVEMAVELPECLDRNKDVTNSDNSVEPDVSKHSSHVEDVMGTNDDSLSTQPLEIIEALNSLDDRLVSVVVTLEDVDEPDETLESVENNNDNASESSNKTFEQSETIIVAENIDTENIVPSPKIHLYNDNSISLIVDSVDDLELVKCGVCGVYLKHNQWDLHIGKEHFYLAWLDGKPPLDLGNDVGLNSHLSNILRRNKTLECATCETKFKRADRFLSHVKKCDCDKPKNKSASEKSHQNVKASLKVNESTKSVKKSEEPIEKVEYSRKRIRSSEKVKKLTKDIELPIETAKKSMEKVEPPQTDKKNTKKIGLPIEKPGTIMKKVREPPQKVRKLIKTVEIPIEMEEETTEIVVDSSQKIAKPQRNPKKKTCQKSRITYRGIWRTYRIS